MVQSHAVWNAETPFTWWCGARWPMPVDGEEDYPAAHSMDSMWFAVDRDGHVAYFTTGESGAVPHPAYLVEDRLSEIERELRDRLPQGLQSYDRKGSLMPRQKVAHDKVKSDNDRFPRLVFLESLDVVQAEIDAGAAVVVGAVGEQAIIVTQPTKALSDRLHATGSCLGCDWHFGPIPGQENEVYQSRITIEELGLYGYSHLGGNVMANPYGRKSVPQAPLHVVQLPPDLRHQISQMTFTDLSFAETLHVQPVEHEDCVSWECAYLDSTGTKIGPIFGCDDGYADEYDNYLKDVKDCEVEPPSERHYRIRGDYDADD